MHRIAHIHLKGPLINAAKALIPEKPISLGWNTQFPKLRWGFVFKGIPSERALKAAQLTGLDFQELEEYSAISLPGVEENDIDRVTERFNIFADEYKSVSKKTASIIAQYINEDATVVKNFTVKAGRRQLGSTAECIKQLVNAIYSK